MVFTKLDVAMDAFQKQKLSTIVLWIIGLVVSVVVYSNIAPSPKSTGVIMGVMFSVYCLNLWVEQNAHRLYTEAKDKDVILFHVNCPTGLLFPEEITSCNYMTDGFKNIHLRYVGPSVVNTDCGINLHSFITDGIYEGSFLANHLMVGDVVHLCKFKNRKDGVVGFLNVNGVPVPIMDTPTYGSFKVADVLV